MRIESDNYTIKVTDSELETIAYSMRSEYIESVKTHWVNHPEAYGREAVCRLKREIIQKMFNVLCCDYAYKSMINEVEEILKKKSNETPNK